MTKTHDPAYPPGVTKRRLLPIAIVAAACVIVVLILAATGAFNSGTDGPTVYVQGQNPAQDQCVTNVTSVMNHVIEAGWAQDVWATEVGAYPYGTPEYTTIVELKDLTYEAYIHSNGYAAVDAEHYVAEHVNPICTRAVGG